MMTAVMFLRITTLLPSIFSLPSTNSFTASGIDAVLLLEDPRREALRGVPLLDPHRALEDDRARSRPPGRRSAPCTLIPSPRTRWPAPGLSAPGKRREERRVDVHDPAPEGVDELGREQSHEPCQQQEPALGRHPLLLKDVEEPPVVVPPAGCLLGVEPYRLDPVLPSPSRGPWRRACR